MSLLQITFLFGVVISTVWGEDGQRCMSSPSWAKVRMESATLKSGSMTPHINITTYMLDFDRDMKMERIAGTVFSHVAENDASATNFTVLNDYGKGKRYSYGMYNGFPYCQVTRIDPTSMNDYCVPSFVNFTGSFRLGSDANSVMIDAFEGMVSNVKWSIQTTATENAPVAFSRTGIEDDGTFVRENGIFLDFAGNSSSSTDVFTIPANCQTVGTGN